MDTSGSREAESRAKEASYSDQLIRFIRTLESYTYTPPFASVAAWTRELVTVIAAITNTCRTHRATKVISPKDGVVVNVPALDLQTSALLTSLADILAQIGVVSQIGDLSTKADGLELNIDRYVTTSIAVPKGVALTAQNTLTIASCTGLEALQRFEIMNIAVTGLLYIVDCAQTQNSGLPAGFATKSLAEAMLGIYQLRVWSRKAAILDWARQSEHLQIRLHNLLKTEATSDGKDYDTIVPIATRQREYMSSLLRVVWGDVLRNCVLLPPTAKVPSTPPTKLPAPEHAKESSQSLAEIRMLAAIEIAQQLCLPEGVYALLDAVCAATDMEDPLACDRAGLAVASVLSLPPVEVITATDYLRCVVPPLIRCLSLRGTHADWFRDVAAQTLHAMLCQVRFCQKPQSAMVEGADVLTFYPFKEQDEHTLLHQYVMLPLTRPLLCYTGTALDAHVETGSVAVTADDLVKCVEDLHAVLSRGPMPQRILLRLLPTVPALFDLYCHCRKNALRKSLASVTAEVLVQLLKQMPPAWMPYAMLSVLHAKEALYSYMNDWKRYLEASCVTAALPPALPARDSRVRYQNASVSAVEIVYVAEDFTHIGGASHGSNDASQRIIHGIAGSSSKGLSGGIMADLMSIGSRMGVTEAKSGDDTIVGDADTHDVDGFTLATRCNAIAEIVVQCSQKHPVRLNPSADVFSAAFQASTGGEALFAWLLQRYASLRCDNAFITVEDTTLLIVLCERVGSGVMRTSLVALQVTRSILHMVLSLLRLHIPTTLDDDQTVSDAPNGSVGTDVFHRAAAIHSAATSRYSSEDVDSSTPIHPILVSEQVQDLLAVCMDLMCAFAASPADESDNSEDAAERWAWIRSTLPLLAAVSTVKDAELAEMATSLQSFILLKPAPTAKPSNSYATSAVSDSKTAPSSAVAAAQRNQGAELLKEGSELLLDPSVAVQNVGLRRFAAAVKAGISSWESLYTTEKRLPTEAWAVYDVSIKQLAHSDTPVVLSALDILESMLIAFPAVVFTKTLASFASDAQQLRTRVKMGQAIASTCGKLGQGQLLQKYAKIVVGCCMKIGVSGWRDVERITQQLQSCDDGDMQASLINDLDDWNDLRAIALVILGESARYLASSCATLLLDTTGGLLGVLSMEHGVASSERSANKRARDGVASVRGSSAEIVKASFSECTAHAVAGVTKVQRAAAYAFVCIAEGFAANSAVMDEGAWEMLSTVTGPMRAVPLHRLDPVCKRHMQTATARLQSMFSKPTGSADRSNARTLRNAGTSVAEASGSVLPGVSISPWTTIIRDK